MVSFFDNTIPAWLKELEDQLSPSSIDKACQLIRTMLIFAADELAYPEGY